MSAANAVANLDPDRYFDEEVIYTNKLAHIAASRMLGHTIPRRLAQAAITCDRHSSFIVSGHSVG